MSGRAGNAPRPAERPGPKCTYWQIAVLRASRRLSPAAKLLLWLMWELDRGVGAWMNAESLADQIGLSPDHVKDLRVHCVRIGVLVQISVKGSKRGLDFWFVQLPVAIDTRPPTAATRAQRVAWISTARDHLDDYIAEREQAGISPLTRRRRPGGNLLPFEVGISPPAAESRRELPDAQAGISRPSEHENTVSEDQSVTLKGSDTESSTDGVNLSRYCARESEDTERLAAQGGALSTGKLLAAITDPAQRREAERLLERHRQAKALAASRGVP